MTGNWPKVFQDRNKFWEVLNLKINKKITLDWKFNQKLHAHTNSVAEYQQTLAECYRCCFVHSLVKHERKRKKLKWWEYRALQWSLGSNPSNFWLFACSVHSDKLFTLLFSISWGLNSILLNELLGLIKKLLKDSYKNQFLYFNDLKNIINELILCNRPWT